MVTAAEDVDQLGLGVFEGVDEKGCEAIVRAGCESDEDVWEKRC